MPQKQIDLQEEWDWLMNTLLAKTVNYGTLLVDWSLSNRRIPSQIRDLGVKQVVNTGLLSALGVELYAIYLDISKPRSVFGIC